MTVKRIRSGRGHRYTVDGESIPGVTTVLRQLAPGKGLRNFPAKAAAEYALNHWTELRKMQPGDRYNALLTAHFQVSSAAAKRGTEVHRLCEMLVDAEDGEGPEVPDELAGHVEAYRDWYDSVRPVTIATELVVANRTHRYCGTADLIADLPAVVVEAELIPPSRWLLDLKTTRTGIWPETALQLCGYQHAEVFVDPDNPDDERFVDWLQIDRCGAIWIKSDAVELRPLETGPEVWETFLHLRALHDQVEAMPGWVGMSAGLAEHAITA